ncbi:THO complex subunit 4 [Trichuris trichiura]|uniref:THO complex subunit 4 n=1 Tax=Trichuris trichiura TaxID=36087 RepID=A0A077ZFF8_TRITR|nr:THO complex subunit 4 [Trichuris trichiura]
MQVNGRVVSEDVGLSLDEIIKKSGNLYSLRGRGYTDVGTRKPSDDGFTIQVTNLAASVTDSDIKDLFSDVGPLMRSCVHYDRNGQSLGVADVVYARRSDAIIAMKQFGNVSLDGMLQ